jgi:hypothetical protein
MGITIWILPLPLFFVSMENKELRFFASGLESADMGRSASVDSKVG